MKDCLILKKKTQLQKDSYNNDPFSLYKLGPAIDKIVAKEKLDLINTFCGGASYANLIRQLSDSSQILVEIPDKFSTAINNGSAVFAPSQKMPGNFTPNIMQDGKIVGQATLKETTDMSKLYNGVANMAVMAMLQNVMGKLDVIDEKITKLLKTHKNDWIGQAIGAFIAFANLYDTFKSKEELNFQVNHSYTDMNEAMGKMLQHMRDLRNELENCPHNTWQTIKSALLHPTRNIPEEMQAKYSELMSDIHIYSRLLLLKNYLLFLKQGADSTFTIPHDPYFEFCKIYLNDDFKSVMEYINDRPAYEIEKINKQRIKIENCLSENQDKKIKFEVTKKELLIANK